MPRPIVVAHSFFLAFDAKQAQKMRPYPPLATLYVAAGLRAAGHDVTVFDAMLAQGEHEFDALVAQVRPSVVVLYEDNFNFLSKMCLSRMREAALTMAASARSIGATVIASGSDVTDHADIYLAGGVEYTALGEGDHSISELINWLDAGAVGSPLHISGLAFRDGDNTVVRTGARRNERHPDVFAHPARDLVDIDRYRQQWMSHHGYFSMNMVSTRGCPFHCNWCAKPIWGQRYAMRSPHDVAAELADVKATFAPDHIWFADDIFGLRPDWVAEFASLVIQRDAVVPFTIQSRCDLMTHEAVAGLARAGCCEVWMGAESGSQRVLDAMDKGTSTDDIRSARRALGEAGIRASFFVQFGYPGETWADIELTIGMIRELLPDDIGISVSYPLPGTRFHSMVVDDLDAAANWNQSNDLQMMFRGAYTTAFYRQLHLALHDDLQMRRRERGLEFSGHPSLPAVTLDKQRRRVADAWGVVAELERTCRNARPTVLLRSAPLAAPDLSLTYN